MLTLALAVCFHLSDHCVKASLPWYSAWRETLLEVSTSQHHTGIPGTTVTPAHVWIAVVSPASFPSSCSVPLLSVTMWWVLLVSNDNCLFLTSGGQMYKPRVHTKSVRTPFPTPKVVFLKEGCVAWRRLQSSCTPFTTASCRGNDQEEIQYLILF